MLVSFVMRIRGLCEGRGFAGTSNKAPGTSNTVADDIDTNGAETFLDIAEICLTVGRNRRGSLPNRESLLLLYRNCLAALEAVTEPLQVESHSADFSSPKLEDLGSKTEPKNGFDESNSSQLSLAGANSSPLTLAGVLDPQNFSVDPPSRKITRESFERPLGGINKTDPNDPFSSINALWSLGK